MTTLITIGNLTKDAKTMKSSNGKDYVLLNIAENIFKRDENGKIVKDENGNSITLQTMYYSVFVNEHSGIALSASNLKKGNAIKVIGKANIDIQKDENGFDQIIVESISAFSIDTDPFNKIAE